jgi:hypothetical protein
MLHLTAYEQMVYTFHLYGFICSMLLNSKYQPSYSNARCIYQPHYMYKVLTRRI